MSESMMINRINNRDFNDEVEKIVVRLHGQKEKDGAKIFLINGIGIKSGATTVAENIAASLAKTEWKTIYVDCDLRKKNQDEENSKNDIVIRKTDIDNLDYVRVGDNSGNAIKTLCSSRMKEFLNDLKEKYDYILIDSTSLTISNDVEIILPYVDKYILVVAQNKTKKKEFTLARIQLANFEDKYMGVIVNNIEKLKIGKLCLKKNKKNAGKKKGK
ncbi:tyrosine-protein kinase family protein [Lachnospiraceae bacterium C1.1]|nr:hypothetical protein [Lachnospiraceae bacterium C1.1]